MADLVVPQLGESITEAVIAKWLKNVGDAVAADEPLVDLETDKITVQLPSPAAGALTEQKFPVGATVKVGDVVGQVAVGAAGKAAAGDGKSAPQPAAAQPAAAPPAAEPAPAPARTKAPTSPGPVPAPAQTPAPVAPVPSAAPVASRSALSKDDLLKLTPSQRAAAREHGTVPGHIRALTQAARSDAAPAVARKADGPAQAPAAPKAVDPRDELVAMSPLRKRVAERLVQAQHETASLTTFNEIDMSAVMDLRARYKEAFEKAHDGTKLGFMSFFVRACVAACKLFPGINAEVAGDSIIYKKHY